MIFSMYMRPASERRPYNITSSLIGWAYVHKKSPESIITWTSLDLPLMNSHCNELQYILFNFQVKAIQMLFTKVRNLVEGSMSLTSISLFFSQEQMLNAACFITRGIQRKLSIKAKVGLVTKYSTKYWCFVLVAGATPPGNIPFWLGQAVRFQRPQVRLYLSGRRLRTRRLRTGQELMTSPFNPTHAPWPPWTPFFPFRYPSIVIT